MEHKERIEKILTAHNNVKSFDALSEENGRKAIQAAITAGESLRVIKDTMPKKFTAWLKVNIKDISPETARRYMRLSKKGNVTDLTDCTSLRQAYLATGILKAASPKKTRTTGTTTASTGTAANGATQTPEGATGFSSAVLNSNLSVPLADKPILSELVASVIEYLNTLTNDDETKAAIIALAPCVAWHNKESKRLLETLPMAA